MVTDQVCWAEPSEHDRVDLSDAWPVETAEYTSNAPPGGGAGRGMGRMATTPASLVCTVVQPHPSVALSSFSASCTATLPVTEITPVRRDHPVET
jgi:hypothetical protein